MFIFQQFGLSLLFTAIILGIVFFIMKKRISKKIETYEKELTGLENTINTTYGIKTLLVSGISLDHFNIDQKKLELVKNELNSYFKDFDNRNSIRSLLGIAIYGILSQISEDKEFLQKVYDEDQKFFQDEELKDLKEKFEHI